MFLNTFLKKKSNKCLNTTCYVRGTVSRAGAEMCVNVFGLGAQVKKPAYECVIQTSTGILLLSVSFWQREERSGKYKKTVWKGCKLDYFGLILADSAHTLFNIFLVGYTCSLLDLKTEKTY